MSIVSKSRFSISVTLVVLATVMFSSLSINISSARADKPSLKKTFRLSDYNDRKQHNDNLYRQQKNINHNIKLDPGVLSNDPIDNSPSQNLLDPNNNPNASNTDNPKDTKQKFGAYDPNSFKTNQFENTPSGKYKIKSTIRF